VQGRVPARRRPLPSAFGRNAGARVQSQIGAAATASDRKMPRQRLDGDPARFGEAIDALPPAELAIAGGADAAEGHLGFVVHGGAVDVADAGVDAAGDGQAVHDVAVEHAGGKAVGAVVGEFHGVIGVAGADDGHDGAEAFVRIKPTVVVTPSTTVAGMMTLSASEFGRGKY
jgi:hypothetical protein